MRETTALGAAIAAGFAVKVWKNFAELRDINRAGGTVFESEISDQARADLFKSWTKAVNMSRGWVGDDSQTKKASQAVDKSISSSSSASAPSADLDNADEEDLLWELRKIEIQQRLKKLQRAKAKD
jgi:glycerol kinase